MPKILKGKKSKMNVGEKKRLVDLYESISGKNKYVSSRELVFLRRLLNNRDLSHVETAKAFLLVNSLRILFNSDFFKSAAFLTSKLFCS